MKLLNNFIIYLIIGAVAVLMFHGLEAILNPIPLPWRILIEILFWGLGLGVNQMYKTRKSGEVKK